MRSSPAAGLVAIALAGCDLVFPPGELPPPDAPLQPEDCPPTYHSIPGAPSIYRIEAVAMLGWPDAEAACEADTIGMTHLVVYDDIAEMLALRTELPTSPFAAHAGYARDPSDPVDRFTAVTGESLSPVSNLWEPGEPTGGAEQITWITTTEDLTDAPHTFQAMYVCECDGRPPTETFTFP